MKMNKESIESLLSEINLPQGITTNETWYTKKEVIKLIEKAFEKGYEQALEDNDILYGEEAEDFLKRMEAKEKEKLTKKERKFVESISKIHTVLD